VTHQMRFEMFQVFMMDHIRIIRVTEAP